MYLSNQLLLSWSFLLLLEHSLSKFPTGCDCCDAMFDPWLKEGQEIAEDPSRVHLATILTSGGAAMEPGANAMEPGANAMEQRYIFYFRHLLHSIFNHSRDVAITLIIITDSLRPIKVIHLFTANTNCLKFSFADVERHCW